MPPGFSWVNPSRLAAMAQPASAEDLSWLRHNGIDVLVSLTVTPPPRSWVNEAGLMCVHVPVPDMTAPTERQMEICVETIEGASKNGMGVAVHCTAGKGRTGTILAAYFVAQGMTAVEAIRKVRELRPGSVETMDQEAVVEEYERRRNGMGSREKGLNTEH